MSRGAASKKKAEAHRPNGLIAQLRAEAPKANKALVARENKKAREALAAAKASRSFLFQGISPATIKRLLASS